MPTKNKRKIAAILAALTLSLLLAACNKDGNGIENNGAASQDGGITPSGGQQDNDSGNMSGVTLHKELGELVYTFHRSGYSLSH